MTNSNGLSELCLFWWDLETTSVDIGNSPPCHRGKYQNEHDNQIVLNQRNDTSKYLKKQEQTGH